MHSMLLYVVWIFEFRSSRFGENLEHALPSLTELILTSNNIQELVGDDCFHHDIKTALFISVEYASSFYCNRHLIIVLRTKTVTYYLIEPFVDYFRVTWTHWLLWRLWLSSGMWSYIFLLTTVWLWLLCAQPYFRVLIYSLLRNPVTNKKHYRLYVISKIPQIRVLDFQKVKLKVSDGHGVGFSGITL